MTKKQDEDTIHYFAPSPNAYDRQQREKIKKIQKELFEQKPKEQGDITKHNIEGGFYYTDKDGNTIPKPKQ